MDSSLIIAILAGFEYQCNKVLGHKCARTLESRNAMWIECS